MAVLESMKKNMKTKEGNSQDIEFAYFAPKAKLVCLAGKFNNWNTRSHPMKRDKDGTWRIFVRLSPGKYEYKFFVDGDWIQDLPCTNRVLNSFGTYDCVIGVR